MARLPCAPRAPNCLAMMLAAIAATTSWGCADLRGRKMMKDADELYKKGRYREAVALFESAEPLVPRLPVLWLNKGYTCRQLLTPGAPPTPESRRWVDCALQAFTRLKEVAPGDPRGEQLYVQTLFDADDFATLEAMFLAQSRAAQSHGVVDLDVATGLQQVYFKWGKWAQALFWARKAADARASDADAQYRLGAFIWQLLASRGGGADMTSFDPRAGAAGAGTGASATHAAAPPASRPPQTITRPPPPSPDDISGALRSDLADEGIRYLEKALALQPRHPEAMIYLNLLYRQKSLAFFAQPAQWQAAVDKANEWQQKGLEARGGGGPNKL